MPYLLNLVYSAAHRGRVSVPALLPAAARKVPRRLAAEALGRCSPPPQPQGPLPLAACSQRRRSESAWAAHRPLGAGPSRLGNRHQHDDADRLRSRQKRYAPRDCLLCPLDFTWADRSAMHIIRPTLLVLAELELWPNWIAAAQREGARVAVINGRLSEKSFRGYQRIAGWLRGTIASARSGRRAERRIRRPVPGPRREQTTGPCHRFDQVRRRPDGPQQPDDQEARRARGHQRIRRCLSRRQHASAGRALAVEAFRQLSPQYPDLRLLITPRHPERFDEVAKLLDRSGVRWERRSALETKLHDPGARILLIDVVGELGAWWGRSDIAFVGGSLGRRGGQNMIEPAAYGSAVCFGPNTWNFKDVVQLLLSSAAAHVVKDGRELQTFIGAASASRSSPTNWVSERKNSSSPSKAPPTGHSSCCKVSPPPNSLAPSPRRPP